MTKWGRILALVTVVQVGTAEASIDPCYADAVIARAAAVIQIVNFTVSGPDANNSCTIAGEVARVFRGGRMFHVGDKVQTSVTCAGDPQVLCGSIWYDPEDIAAAGAIEVHVEREGDAPVGAESVLLLPAVTDKIVWTSACGN
jgi:hypothetical protein